jgi:hypothetical protein
MTPGLEHRDRGSRTLDGTRLQPELKSKKPCVDSGERRGAPGMLICRGALGPIGRMAGWGSQVERDSDYRLPELDARLTELRLHSTRD